MKLLTMVLMLTVACSGNDPQTGDDDDDGGGTAGGDTCAEVFDCIVDCGNGEACANTCFDAGSSDAQDLILALEDCIAEFECTDNACVDEHCNRRVDACFADSGTDDQMGTPLPAELVGSWSSQSFSGTAGSLITYAFTADGQVQKVAVLQFGPEPCQSTFAIEYKGVVRLVGDAMSIDPRSGTSVILDCNGQPTREKMPYDDDEHLRVAIVTDEDGDVLQLTNLDTNTTLSFHRD
ncbi:MAG: hypothetical protein ABI867_23775 [Kofleriaceae bacterium]